MDPSSETLKPTVIIAGKDCSADLGARIQKRVASRQGPTLLAESHPEASALSLRDLPNQNEFLDRYLELMRTRFAIRLQPPPARGPKPLQVVQKVFRKIFSFQHAQIAAEQSQINEVLIMGMRFEREQQEQRIADLEARLQKLEGGAS